MTFETQPVHTVTVPVGLGGKTTPYVPDPPPTFLVELGVADPAGAAAAEEAEAILGEARRDAEITANALLDDALARADVEADKILSTAREEADRIIADARDAAASAMEEAERAIATRRDEVEGEARRVGDLEAGVADREAGLESRAADLDRREEELAARYEAVDREAEEASTVLAAARNDADGILLEARNTAEAIVDDARIEASERAAEIIRRAEEELADADDDGARRIAELEHVHRIEIQVLRDREASLIGQVTELERRLARQASAPPTGTSQPQPPVDPPQSNGHRPWEVPVEPFAVSESSPGESEGRRGEDTLIELDPEESTRRTIRHNAGSKEIASHQPLTEQLSASAFRSTDKRGRRRR